MNIILYDPAEVRERLLPLTFTRPVALLRHGIMTIAEKWQRELPGDYSFLTQDYLSAKYPTHLCDDNLFIAGNVEPTKHLGEAIRKLKPGHSLNCNGVEVARRSAARDCPTEPLDYAGEVLAINEVWDVFMANGAAIERDFDVLTHGRESQPLSPTNRVVGDPSRIFIEPGAVVECANLNVTNGPIYVGPDAEIMEGASLRGPIALCGHAHINMGAKVYGDTTLGPYCKVGGEVNNVVFTGYSNKSHDGYLGNSVIGEWCNLGAGCTSSNLKNSYAKIRLWSYKEKTFVKTDLQFCGLIMGDHSKAAINTSFNTATVVGVGVNFYGAGFPRTFLPSFHIGSPALMKPVIMDKFFETAEIVMSRRGQSLTPEDRQILTYLNEHQ